MQINLINQSINPSPRQGATSTAAEDVEPGRAAVSELLDAGDGDGRDVQLPDQEHQGALLQARNRRQARHHAQLQPPATLRTKVQRLEGRVYLCVSAAL